MKLSRINFSKPNGKQAVAGLVVSAAVLGGGVLALPSGSSQHNLEQAKASSGASISVQPDTASAPAASRPAGASDPSAGSAPTDSTPTEGSSGTTAQSGGTTPAGSSSAPTGGTQPANTPSAPVRPPAPVAPTIVRQDTEYRNTADPKVRDTYCLNHWSDGSVTYSYIGQSKGSMTITCG